MTLEYVGVAVLDIYWILSGILL